MSRVITDVFDFTRARAIPASGSAEAGFAFVAEEVSGTGSAASISNGELLLALDASNEAQVQNVHFDDVLAYTWAEILKLRAWVRTPVAMGTNALWRVGACSAKNATFNNIAEGIFVGADVASIVVESDDGVTDRAAQATGLTMGTALTKIEIDFRAGTLAQQPPLLNKGGIANVQCRVQNAQGSLEIVDKNRIHDLSAATSRIQVLIHLAKAASTDLGSLAVKRIEVDRDAAD